MENSLHIYMYNLEMRLGFWEKKTKIVFVFFLDFFKY